MIIINIYLLQFIYLVKKSYEYPITNKDKSYIALNKLINDVKGPNIKY